MKEKGTVITKRINKTLFGKKYMIGVMFDNIYSIKSESNTKEFRVSYVAYSQLNVNDKVLCPVKEASDGLIFDYSRALEHI